MAPVLANILQYSCLKNPSDIETWQAIVCRATELDRSKPAHTDTRLFFALAALPPSELGVKVAKLLGLQGPWQRQVCTDTDCLLCGSYGPLRVFFRASGSWQSEGLFGQSFCIALPPQAHRGLPCLGSFSVDPHVRHLKGRPGWGPTQ